MIVVGARVAGSATAMLLSRKGFRVLVVDRATFPSDTLSTHQIQLPGVARLHRWGLLDRLAAAGTPAIRDVRFDSGQVVLRGRFPSYDGVDALYSPRRTRLDAMLVDAAREAGAEVRTGFAVDEVVRDGDRVVGIRGHRRGGGSVTETARLVIGADGKRSTVAAAVAAARYGHRPPATLASYTYWSGVGLAGGELYQRPDRAVAAFPTDDDLTMIYIAAPIGEFPAFRADVEGHHLRTLDLCGDLGERVRGGERAERFRTTPDLPHGFRTPYGPGWALVGDAGLVFDPISAQGISNAFRDVELLVDAVAAGFDHGGRIDAALAGYRALRDAAAGPLADFTADLAAFRPPSAAERQLLASLVGRPAEIDRFLGAFAGVTPMRRYRTPTTALRLLGLRGLANLAVAVARRQTAGHAGPPRRAWPGGTLGRMEASKDDDEHAGCWLHPLVEVGESAIEGRGLFATGPLAAGTVVARLGGRHVSGADLERLFEAAGDDEYIDTIAIRDDLHLVLPAGDPIHYGNHSCEPNVWHDGPYRLVARRDIPAGEELTVDYATQTTKSGFTFACHCGAAGCRVTVSGDDWRRPEWQRRYRDHVVPAVADRIAG